MTTLTIQISESLQRSIEALAKEEGYSVDQFLATAAAEKIAAVRTLAYLRNEAIHGRRADFERFLAAVPDREPCQTDQKPE